MWIVVPPSSLHMSIILYGFFCWSIGILLIEWGKPQYLPSVAIHSIPTTTNILIRQGQTGWKTLLQDTRDILLLLFLGLVEALLLSLSFNGVERNDIVLQWQKLIRISFYRYSLFLKGRHSILKHIPICYSSNNSTLDIIWKWQKSVLVPIIFKDHRWTRILS